MCVIYADIEAAKWCREFLLPKIYYNVHSFKKIQYGPVDHHRTLMIRTMLLSHHDEIWAGVMSQIKQEWIFSARQWNMYMILPRWCARCSKPVSSSRRYESLASSSSERLLSDGKHTRFSATPVFFTRLI